MKTILVTGANAGMGYNSQTIGRIGDACDFVLPFCRTRAAAQQRLKEETGNPSIDLVIGDLGSLASVRKSAAEINARFEKWMY